MVSVDKQALISQLCTASKLQGKDLEEYRARLNKMSETELSALISGDNKGENVDTVELNHSQGVNKTEITKKDAEDSAIQTIESNANQAIQMIDSQDDGNISDAYNKLKEKFDSDLAKSNVEKIVYKQLETAYFLKEAQANNLTYREYFEQRKELLYKTFPGIERFNDKQKQSLKRMIDSLSPEQVLEQQDKILSLPEAGTEGYDDSVRSFLNDFKTETTDSVIVQNKEFGMKVKTQPKSKFELADGERLMPFDEVYYLEQGVKFNKDNIQKYNESAAQFAFVNSVNQKREEVHKILEEPLKLVKGNNALGANPDVINSSNKQLNTAVYSALAKLYGNDEGKIKQGLKELTGENYSFKNGELVLEDSKFKFNTDTILPNIAQTILDKIDSNYEKMTNGKSLEDYANQMAEDYKSAYGSKDATNLASAYVQDQEGMVQNIRTGVELVGAGVMVAGMIFFPPAALAGGAVAGFGGAGVELYNESTRDNVNTERTGELKKELVINSLLMVVGMGAGKAGSAMKAVLTAKNAPKLAAIAGDIGTDATISLLGDLALTGQVNIEGEGFAQFLSLVAGHKGKIVSGIKHVKDNIKAKFGPDARQMPDGTIYKVNQDGSTTVLRDVVETPGVNDGAGISHTTTDTPAGQSDLAARLDNAKSREDFIAIRDELKKMPAGAEKTALMETYQKKYREWAANPDRPDIRMEYKPEDDVPTFKIDKELAEFLKNLEIKMEYKPEDDVPSFKTNEELAEFLKNEKIKDADGNEVSRFSDDEINKMIEESNTQEDRDAIGFLAGLKKDDGEPRFNGNEISMLSNKAQTPEGRDAIEFLVGFKKDDGEPRFNGNEIRNLADIAQTPEDRDAIEYLAGLKGGDKPRFNGNEISALSDRIQTPQDQDAIEYLAGLKKDSGESRFSGFDISSLVYIAKTQKDQDAIKFLAEIKKDSGESRFDGLDISFLVNKAKTEKDKKAIEYLAGLKDGDKPRFSGYDISFLVNKAKTEKDKKAIEYLAGLKDGDKPRFDSNEISMLANTAQTQEGRDAIEFLAGFKIDGMPKFRSKDIVRLAEAAITPENKTFIKKLVDEYKNEILKEINGENIELAKKLCMDKDLDITNNVIPYILHFTKAQNIKLAEQLCRDKNLSKDSIPNILFSVEGIEKPFAYLYENDSVFKDYTINHGMFGNLQLAVSFWDLNNKTSISELSKVEKKKVLMNLLANKNNLKNNDLRDIMPLLPQNDTEYANIIKSITQSLNMSSKPLDAAQQKEFNTSLNNLTNSLKTMDLSNLTEVNLTMPHTEFIKQVQDIMKDLPMEEQAKIQDYFGFKIDNGRLTGYPNSDGKDLSLSGITDKKSLAALDKVKNVVDNYTDNNFVTVKDNPILNQQLKDISKYMPEIFNQIDGSGLAVSTIKSLQKVVQNPKFDTLSDSDKKVMVLSTLLHNTDKVSGSTSESAFDAYFISQRFGVSDIEAQKIYKIVESSDLIDKFMSTTKTADNPNERKNVFDLLAFNLKEGNDFELAQMLYSSKEQDGLTRYLDKALEKRIEEIKSNDFMLPQTSQNEYFTRAKDEVIEKDGIQYNVKVVSSSDIDNFYALVHTPDAGFTSGGSRMANFANFEIFKDFADDKVVCAGYIGNDQAGLVNEFHKGFIFEVPNDKQYVGYGTDIWSNARNIPAMIADYYRDNGQYAYHGRGERFDHRTMISNELKSLLYKPDEADIDKKYAARLENIKNQLGTETMTLARLQEIDPEFANAYKEFLSRDNQTGDEHYLMRQDKWHNEILVSNPKITAIFTDNLNDLPVEYLEKAQEENLPIVIVK